MDTRLSLRFDPGIYRSELYECTKQVNSIIDDEHQISIGALMGIFKAYTNVTTVDILGCDWSKDEVLYYKLKVGTFEERSHDSLVLKATWDLVNYYKDDPVNHPSHYETNGIECFDAIQASQGDNAAVNFAVCNAFKYIWRNQHKDAQVQDLKKAVWYLNKAVDILEGEENNER